jgi:predicted dithiol-disulfide oxidoreductase (DUF899 family)/pimeloyl-ACP methyl ester carboxylesterase
VVLLIGGAAATMDWWEDEFCERIAAGGRYVVRYDNRDTGRSTSSPAGRPNYTGMDLTADAIGLLDALDVAQAHLIGISMGGGIAQEIALQYPERVASLVVLSTTPVGPAGPDRPELPSMSPELRQSFSDPGPDPDWTDREVAIDEMVKGERLFSGRYRVDESRVRAVAGRAFDRTIDFAASQTNHWILDGGESSGSPVNEITAPTLVLHGTDDPLFPIGHGEALAREIPGARLMPLDKVGHQMPPQQTWDVVVDAILLHTATPPGPVSIGDEPTRPAPRIVSRKEWLVARDQLLLEEKAATHALDALAAERRRLPMVEFGTDYVFATGTGEATLLELFQGCRQLVVYQFMDNGPDDYCPGCTTYTDNTDSTTGRPYIYRRDTAYVTLSDMPIDQFQAYAKHRGWVGRFYSSHGTTFRSDCGIEGGFGLSVFLRDGNLVYQSYLTGSRGVDRLMFHSNVLDLTPLGRSEPWEA